MKPDEYKRYDDPNDYFALDSSASMQLTADAAMEVCRQAAERGLIVVRIEGGKWCHPGFMPSLGCIWDGADPPVTAGRAHENNLAAAAFIKEMSETYDPYIRRTFDAFILTDAPITGYRHKMKGSSGG